MRKYVQFYYIGIVMILFILIAGFSIHSINRMQGAARVIHYTGFIGGATQIVVKEEMSNQENDSLIQLIDEMIQMLQTGEGDYNVPVLNDETYQGHMKQIEVEWEKIKSEIYKIRKGADSKLLYAYSENTYDDTNLAAYAAQAYMENSVSQIKTTMYFVYMIFFLMLVLFLYTLTKNTSLMSRAESLNKIAYYDPYVGIANKAYCEKKIKEYEINSYDGYLAIIMFDLNDLKTINDEYGHQAGDTFIRNFAHTLDTVGREYGFVGRYGGDEFIAIFDHCDEYHAKAFMKNLVFLLKKINIEAKNPWEKISCAAGYAVGYQGDKSIQSLLKEADDHMYHVKRIMKEKIKQKEDIV
ncbi:MAG: GGDEF domain-containing protein [Velocimicrobium sp.]